MSETHSAYVITAGDKTLRPVAGVVMAGGLRIQTEYEPQDPGPKSRAVRGEPSLSTYDNRDGSAREVIEEIPPQLLGDYPEAEYVFVNIGEFSRLPSGGLSGGITSYRLDRENGVLELVVIDQIVNSLPEGRGEIAADILEALGGLAAQARGLEKGEEIEGDRKRKALDFGNRLSGMFDDYLNFVLKTKTATFPRFIAEQGRISRQLLMEHSTNNTVNRPFMEHYEPRKDKFVELTPVRVSRRGTPQKAFNYVSIRGNRELDYFDQLVFCALRTCLKEHPEDPAVTFLDIANKLFISGAKYPLRGNKHETLINRIKSSVRNLMTTEIKLDFCEQLQGYAKNSKFQEYLSSEMPCEFVTTYVNGVYGRIKITNGKILEGIVADSKTANALIDYLEMCSQIRRVEGDVLINPLSATPRNIMIFHYMLNKIYAMPYGNSGTRLLEQRLECLELRKAEEEAERERSKAQDSQEPSVFGTAPEGDSTALAAPIPAKTSEGIAEGMRRVEESVQRRNLTISLDTIIKDLKLTGPNDGKARVKEVRREVARQCEKLLRYWKKRGLLESYQANPKPSGRGVQSFTVGFFLSLDNVYRTNKS